MKVTESAIVDGGDKSSSILRAAAQVFAERGYEAATVEAIAEHARIAKGTVHSVLSEQRGVVLPGLR